MLKHESIDEILHPIDIENLKSIYKNNDKIHSTIYLSLNVSKIKKSEKKLEKYRVCIKYISTLVAN